MRPQRRVRAANTHADADQRTPHQNPAEHNRQHSPATATPALSYSIASTLNKGAAGMQLVEAGLHAMSDPISQRPNRESHLQKGAAGMQLVEAGLRAIQHPATSAQQYRKPPAKGGSAGKQLVEAGLRAIGLSVQQILCALRFSPAPASAALSTAMRAARDRLRARTARRARRRTRCTCAHEPRYNFNFKVNI